MPKHNFGFIGVRSNRSAVYLQMLCNQHLYPDYAIIMHEQKESTPEEKYLTDQRSRHEQFNLSESLDATLEKNNIPYELVPTRNPNSQSVVQALSSRSEAFFIYSGPGGVILKKLVLNAGVHLLHVHSGVVPYYRGSTTSYYSLINENVCGASAFIMNEKIDEGPVIKTRVFPPPEDRTTIDVFYDSYIRAKLLCEVVSEFVESGELKTQPKPEEEGETYYIIHPVLKHIAILGN